MKSPADKTSNGPLLLIVLEAHLKSGYFGSMRCFSDKKNIPISIEKLFYRPSHTKRNVTYD